MEVKITSGFANDFKVVQDVSLREKVKNVLEAIKMAKNMYDISQFRRIHGHDKAFKMGIGFYFLVGIMTSEDEITLMRFLHRDVLMNVFNK